MADRVTAEQLDAFFIQLNKLYSRPATVYLLGGTALALLGSSRPTLDIDYVGTDIPERWDELQRSIHAVAAEMGLDLEAVPFDKMVPLPSGHAQRHILYRAYGHIRVFVFDPLAIALGKIERGTESDLEDVAFLIVRRIITLKQLEEVVQEALPRAQEYDMNPGGMIRNLETVRRMLRR